MKDETNPLEKELNKVKFTKYKNKKNNILVAGMYAMYKTGKSLAFVAKNYRKSRQAVFELFITREYKLRSKELKGLTTIDGINFTETKDGYLRGTIGMAWNGKKRILAHQYIWEKNKGSIPLGFVIYHKDGNKKNNLIENLELVQKKDMVKKFNPNYHNQFTKFTNERNT